jgi:ribonuclease BN (tRNA processing enzyme)
LTFLGTGNYLAPAERYWNSFVLRGLGTAPAPATVLVEPSPSALPNLRRAGFSSDQLDVVMISHFHPDHSFGWPFLVLDLIMTAEQRCDRPLSVVGPPKVKAYLDDMMRLGSVQGLQARLGDVLDLRYVEASTVRAQQAAGPVAFRAIEVEHVPDLACYAYVVEIGGLRVGYSGDTRPCAGLDDLAAASDTLVVECNGAHPHKSHMDVDRLLELRERHPEPFIVATHLGDDVTADLLPGIRVPADYDVIVLGENGRPTELRPYG